MEKDEIDLMDYIKVILKRKKLIFGIIFLVALGAAVLSFVLPKVYGITTSLEIGVLKEPEEGKVELIEDPNQVVAKFEGDVYGILVKEKLGISEKDYPEIEVNNPKDTNLVVAEIRSDKNEQAKNILDEINNIILSRHQEKIKIKKELLQKDIESVNKKIELSNDDIIRIENKIKTTENDIETTKNKIKPLLLDIERIEIKIETAEAERNNLEDKVAALEETLVYEQTPGTQYALFDAKEKLLNKIQEIENLYLNINSTKGEIEDYNLEISSLEREIEDYNSEINSLQINIENYNSQINALNQTIEDIKPTKIVKQPTVSENPVSPRTLLNIIVAGILGLFLGTFLAFFKEFWEKNKNLA